MIGGRKMRSNKGKKRGAYGSRTGKTRSGARFRSNNKVKRTRKARSNKGKKRGSYGPRSRTRSGAKFRGKPRPSPRRRPSPSRRPSRSPSQNNNKQSLTPSEMARLGYGINNIKQAYPSMNSNELSEIKSAMN
jgi:hypothetical protein